mmetsp:Transcript_48369/g.114219  ORF Transcript_48369/g.114219 Transcript_48369/m.114219 type:complete len:424 (-) Transcript_48369:20-1291(-)
MKKEGNINFSSRIQLDFPPGVLVALIQRGIVYSQIETDFSLFSSKLSRSPVENSFFLLKNELDMYLKGRKINKNVKKRKVSFLDCKLTLQICNWHPRRLCAYFGTRNSQLISLSLSLEKKKEISTSFQNSLFSNLEELTEEKVLFLDFNPIGTLLAAGTFFGYLLLFSETGKILKKENSHSGSIFELKWSEDSKFIVVGNLFGNVSIWSSWYSKFLLRISLQSAFQKGLSWVGKYRFLNCSKYETISFCDIDMKNVVHIKMHTKKTSGVAFSDKKKIMACFSEKGFISLWLLNRNFKFLFVLLGHHKGITSVIFDPLTIKKRGEIVNPLLFSGSLDGSVKIWDLQFQTCKASIDKTSPVFSLTKSPCGCNMAIGTFGRISMLNFPKNETASFEIKSKFGVFLICSHPMVDKIIGCTLDRIFYT